MRKDVFICHASEDKPSIVRPLACALADRGLTYWLDEAEIFPGQSITERVNEGLKISDYVVVIFSRAFMAKNWPKRELWAVLNLEAGSGKTIIIPVLVGTPLEVDQVVAEYPLINDKLFLLWDGNAQRVANGIQNTIHHAQGIQTQSAVKMMYCGRCQTPSQLGIHVCLGCHGSIVYGLTRREKAEVRQLAAGVLVAVAVVIGILIPSYASPWLGVRIPTLFGLGIMSLPVAAVIILLSSLCVESYVSKKRAHWIRTFPP